jgi:hypothetical protein
LLPQAVRANSKTIVALFIARGIIADGRAGAIEMARLRQKSLLQGLTTVAESVRLGDPMADAGNRTIDASVVGHRDRLLLIHLLTVVDPDKF